MNPNGVKAQRQLITAWQAVRAGMQKMYQASDVRPGEGLQIFKFDADVENDEVKFNVGPLVFRVPERATHQDANLYIVIEGWISFESTEFDPQNLKTKSFGTTVGYFRYKNGALEHVYGAHYDLDEYSFGHPVFHAQIKPQMEFGAYINEWFHQTWNAENKIQHILAFVRTPSAQMDIFSVITQICADHLIHRDSGPEIHQAFTAMRKSCDFFLGAAHRMDYLKNEPAPLCYRSTHWYEGH